MRVAIVAIACSAAVVAGACRGEVFGPDDVVSVALDSLPFPAVVVGDSLRDSLGVVAPLRATAFNYRGEQLTTAIFRYLALDRGVFVDSTSGLVRGDSLRESPVRLAATVGSLQTAPAQLRVVMRPDSLAAATPVDTIRYSLVDTTQNVSRDLTVRVLHRGSPVSGVPSWLVSYQITYPTDTARARLINESGTRTAVDTTATDGSASRRVRIAADRVAPASDSVVVLATVRYRGAHVAASPRRFVVHLRPRTP